MASPAMPQVANHEPSPMVVASCRTLQVSGNQVAEQLQRRLEASEKRCTDLEAQSAELENKLRKATEEAASYRTAQASDKQALEAAQQRCAELEAAKEAATIESTDTTKAEVGRGNRMTSICCRHAKQGGRAGCPARVRAAQGGERRAGAGCRGFGQDADRAESRSSPVCRRRDWRLLATGTRPRCSLSVWALPRKEREEALADQC
eukprot:s1698_g3.t6